MTTSNNTIVTFDGKYLSYTDQEGNLVKIPAISGRVDYQDPQYQNLEDKGSLPEGTYYVKQDEYQNYEDGVIVNNQNGLLVDNYNIDELANAFSSFVNDEKLYLSCKTNAKQSVTSFAVENIAKQWQNLIEN